MGANSITAISAHFVDDKQTPYFVYPGTEFLYAEIGPDQYQFVDFNGYVLEPDSNGTLQYKKDDKANPVKLALTMQLRVLMESTANTKQEIKDDIYYLGGYYLLDIKEEKNAFQLSYNYNNPFAVKRFLDYLAEHDPENYAAYNLTEFHKIAIQKKNELLNKHERPQAAIEIDLKNHQQIIDETNQQRFTTFRLDGLSDYYIKIDNRRVGTDSELTQCINAEFFRCFAAAPKSVLVYAKGSNEIIGVATEALPGLSLFDHFKNEYEEWRVTNPAAERFGLNGNYNIEYPQEIIDKLVNEGNLVELYVVGTVRKESDAHWGNFLVDPKTNTIYRIDFDLTDAPHMFSLQQNPLYDDIYRQARGCDVTKGYDYTAADLTGEFAAQGNASGFQPYRSLKAHAFGNGKELPNENNRHPKLAAAVDNSPQTQFRQFKTNLNFLTASEADIQGLVIHFTQDSEQRAKKIDEIKKLISNVKLELATDLSFQRFLRSENSIEAIKLILKEKLDYYLDPLPGCPSMDIETLRQRIRTICRNYLTLTGKVVPEDELNQLFIEKVGEAYTLSSISASKLLTLIPHLRKSEPAFPLESALPVVPVY